MLQLCVHLLDTECVYVQQIIPTSSIPSIHLLYSNYEFYRWYTSCIVSPWVVMSRGDDVYYYDFSTGSRTLSAPYLAKVLISFRLCVLQKSLPTWCPVMVSVEHAGRKFFVCTHLFHFTLFSQQTAAQTVAQLCRGEMQSKNDTAAIIGAFKILDKDNSGTVSVQELLPVMLQLGEMTEPEVATFSRSHNLPIFGF